MPLTPLQHTILAVIGPSRTPESYVAGGTALHFAPNSARYSRDLDIFHDALAGVAEAFERDSQLLAGSGFSLETLISQPGFIRALVELHGESTQIDWARDSAWRFMPVMKAALGGYVLHDVDLATNKILALAGRDEPRDFVDTLYILDHILPLGPLVWSAAAKDPGYSPLSLLEQIRRRGKYQAEDFKRLDLVKPFDQRRAKRQWTGALEMAEEFVLSRPPHEAGCLYYDASADRFTAPESSPSLEDQGLVTHFGRAGGILPRPSEQSL
ncbi:MAG: hypothetical protein ACI80V_002032 [Rhodothermales bacterium]|jgi:hypothetical protein